MPFADNAPLNTGSPFKMLHTKKPTRCTLLLLLMLCVSTCCRAKEFIIGVEDISYYPHFDFQQQDSGFGKALLDAFARDKQYTFTYLSLPIRRFSQWLYEEDIDFKYPDNVRWQNIDQTHNVQVYFSRDIVQLTAGTLVLAKNAHRPRNFVKNLGTLSGFQATLWLDRIKQKRVRLLEDPSSTILVKHLLRGIVDGLDMDYSVVLHQLAKLSSQEQVVISPNMPSQNYAFQLSTLKHPKVIGEFNLWLQQNQPLIKQLKQQYQIMDVLPEIPEH